MLVWLRGLCYFAGVLVFWLLLWVFYSCLRCFGVYVTVSLGLLILLFALCVCVLIALLLLFVALV